MKGTPQVPLKPRRILIVRLSALGDVVCTLPALTSLRKGYPDAHIAWLVEDRSGDLLKDHPLLDELIVFPRSRWQQTFSQRVGHWRTLADCYQFFSGLRSRRFDTAIDFQGNAKSGFLTYVSGARLRVGFDRRNSTEGNFVFINRRVPIANPYIARTQKYLELAHAVGGAPGRMPAVLATWRDESAKAAAFFRRAALRRPVVVIHPGTSEFGAFKRWPPERFGELARRLARHHKASILITWGPRERTLAAKVAATAGRAATLSMPTRSLRELAELLRRADLFIGADTGPMHIAAAVGVPVVALFGPKDPVLHRPYTQRSRIVRAGVECSPCTKRTCNDVRCMTAITVDMVLAAARELLKAGKRPARRVATRPKGSTPSPKT